MKHRLLMMVFITVLLPVILLSSCNSMEQMIQGTPTFTPTITLTPSPTSKPTVTLTPTATMTNTPTPNATATEFANRSELMFAEVQKFVDLGYLSDSIGRYSELPEFDETFAQINWYQRWRTDFLAANFVFSAHFSWDTANDSPYISGCGLALVPESDPYYTQVFILHRSKVVVLNNYGYEVRSQKGTGHVDISSPLEADFTIIADVTNKIANVFVNDQFVGKYKLDFPSTYYIGYVIFSGTSTDYGTHCKITNPRIWKLQ